MSYQYAIFVLRDLKVLYSLKIRNKFLDSKDSIKFWVLR